MAATLTLTHKAIGVEVRRGTYDVVLDGKHVGSVEMNDTFETPIEPGRHTLQVRNGRNSTRTNTSDAARAKPSRSDAAERPSCRSASCPSFPAWQSRSIASRRGSPIRRVRAAAGTAGCGATVKTTDDACRPRGLPSRRRASFRNAFDRAGGGRCAMPSSPSWIVS